MKNMTPKFQLVSATRKKLAIFQCIIGLTLLANGVAYGNDASIQNNGRFGPEPYNLELGEESPLKLVEETLTFDFGKSFTSVRVKFLFQNSTNKPIKQISAFPDLALGWQKLDEEMAALPEEERKKMAEKLDPIYYEFPYSPATDKWESFGKFSGILTDLETRVNGKTVSSNLVYGKIRTNRRGDWLPATDNIGFPMAWYLVTLNVPPNGAVILERKYKAQNTIHYAGVHANLFDYVTTTGKGWKGPIGKIVVTVNLKDDLTVDAIKWKGPGQDAWDQCMIPERKKWEIIDEKTMKLEWTNFEPTIKDGNGFIRLAWDSDWVDQNPEERAGSWTGLTFVRFLENSKGGNIRFQVEFEHYAEPFTIVLAPGVEMTSKDREALSARAVKPGTKVEFDGVRTKPREIKIGKGEQFRILQ